MTVSIDGPVGLRFHKQNVKNNARDQVKVIQLLAKIPAKQGGKKEAWPVAPLPGGDGICPRLLVDSIWDFQSFWKSKGVFKNIDAVVDPNMNTLRQLNKLASGGSIDPPSPPGDVNWTAVLSAAKKATSEGVARWAGTVSFTKGVVNSLTASGGQVSSAFTFESDLGAAVQAAGAPKAFATALASAVWNSWQAWFDGYSLPGLPWYPAFVAFPAPVAPPMPNTPSPVNAGMTRSPHVLTEVVLITTIRQRVNPVSQGTKNPEPFIVGYARWMARNFPGWIPGCKWMNVMGTGPVPSFAPPAASRGPVVNGTFKGSPGCFVSGPRFGFLG